MSASARLARVLSTLTVTVALVAAFGATAASQVPARPQAMLSFAPESWHLSVPFPLPEELSPAPTIELTLTNSGSVPAGGLRLLLAPSDTPFSVVAETCPAVLRPGAACTVTLGYSPTAASDLLQATFTASTNRARAVLHLSGEARDDSLPRAEEMCPEPYYGKCRYGTPGDDVIYGSAVWEDYIWGYQGNDHLHGSAMADELWGGPGNDTLEGGINDDALMGEDGNDTLQGKAGDDYLEGGQGADKLYGGDGDDYLWATVSFRNDNGAIDVVDGEDGYDECWGNAEDEFHHCEAVTHLIN
jgi:hypothetical protein